MLLLFLLQLSFFVKNRIKTRNSLHEGRAVSMYVLWNINMLSLPLAVMITPHPNTVFVFIIETV